MATPDLAQPDFVGDADQRLLARGREVISAEAAGLMRLAATLNHGFIDACHAILDCRRQVVVTGMGKSGLIARKIAATFAATGTPAAFLHPGEAGHGDLGMLASGDVLVVLSNSGNTPELVPVIRHARHLGITVIGMASRPGSILAERSDIALLMPAIAEACPARIAPTTSTTMQLALGDALAMAVMDLRGMTRERLGQLHPAGAIGLALMPVRELMHPAERLPLVMAEAGMPEAISIITQGCFGVAGVTDSGGNLVGIITDGDLRRRFGLLGTAFAHEVMTRDPKVLLPETPAGDALAFLTANQITAAFVVEEARDGAYRPVGIVHIHDLLRRGLN